MARGWLTQIRDTLFRKALREQLLPQDIGELPAEELAEILGMSVEEISEAILFAQEPVPLQTRVNGYEETCIEDLIEDKKIISPADAFDRQNLREITHQLLREHLTLREEMIIMLRFGIQAGYEHTPEEAGVMFNVTRQCIDGIEAKALRKLRYPPRRKLLEEFREYPAHAVEVRTGRPSKRAGERIPPQRTAEDEIRQMSEDEILKLEAESVQIGHKLASIFEQAEGLAGGEANVPSKKCPEGEIGLGSRYQALLKQLLRRKSWDRKSFESLVRQHGFMVSDAIGTINEWADQALGDFLIEDGEPVVLNLSLLRKALDEQTH